MEENNYVDVSEAVPPARLTVICSRRAMTTGSDSHELASTGPCGVQL